MLSRYDLRKWKEKRISDFCKISNPFSGQSLLKFITQIWIENIFVIWPFFQPKKRSFGGRKRRGMEDEDLLCPMDEPLPVPLKSVKPQITAANNNTQKQQIHGNYKVEVRSAERLHRQADEVSQFMSFKLKNWWSGDDIGLWSRSPFLFASITRIRLWVFC